MGLNIENVAKALGISKKSAEALDALDGKSDKQVKQSIYDEAAKLLNAARTSKGDRSVFANAEFKEEVYNALEDDLTKIMGFVKEDSKQPSAKPKDTMVTSNHPTSRNKINQIKITLQANEFTADALTSLPSGVSIDANGSIILDIDVLLQNPRSLSELKKVIGDKKAFNQAVLDKAITELNNSNNKAPMAQATFEEYTFEEFADRFKENKAVVLIASSFIDENGNWDRDGFKEFLNKCAGDMSILNREELIAGVRSKMTAVASDIETRSSREYSIMVARDKLKPKMQETLQALVDTGIVTYIHGNFDLSKLSEIIRDHVGADMKLSRSDKRDSAINEQNNLRRRLMEIGVPDVSNTTIKDLCKLCGYNIE